MLKKLVIVCLFNFFIAALLGLALRWSALQAIGINYRFLTHAHSHVAMLGWVYLMLYTLIVHYFIPDKKPIYKRLFWLTELAVIGMLLSFPFQGYAAVSIAFSTLHIFCSYYFAYLIFKHVKTESAVTSILLKWALAFMLISTIGVWCLGPAVSMLGQASAFYQIAIQFFLHFQFNGWFLLAVIALFFHKLQLKDSKQFRAFFKCLIIGTLFTLALPVNWFLPHSVLIWINGIGVISQLLALYYFVILVRPAFKNQMESQAATVKLMYSFALVCFVFKMVLQSLSLVPEVSTLIYQHKNFIIGFIHLTMLGVISGFLFAFICSEFKLQGGQLQLAIAMFLLGFLATELLLFYQGLKFYLGLGFVEYYHQLLLCFSLLLPLSIGLFLINVFFTKSKSLL